MKSFIFAKEKLRKMDCLDMALIKLSCIAFGVLLVILIPALNNVNRWWPLLATIALAIRPIYRAYLKKA